MKRCLVILFAVLLPVQFAWAGVTAYCQHETTPSRTTHFGHHEHVHQAAADASGTSTPAGDNDCGTCHAAAAAVIPDHARPMTVVPLSGSIVPHVLRRMPTALARAPDRPQWPRLA